MSGAGLATPRASRTRLFARRSFEGLALVLISLILLLGFLLVEAARQMLAGADPLPALGGAILPPVVVAGFLFGLHLLLRARGMELEQVLLPVTALLLALGLVMIWRLRGEEGVWQQIGRGFVPGMIIMMAFVYQPRLVERLRRAAIPVSLVGLALPIATAFFGVVDETGARLALKIGPLPPIQTSEFIKVALVIFLAWYIEREGQEAEGRARPLLLGWLRLPAVRYFVPGALFVALAALALVQMSDFGAVPILGALFVAMLYAGFETRTFATVAAIGLALALGVGLVLALAWEPPGVIQQRFLAFRDPWSQEVITIDGRPTGVTISEGPGYQIQQSVYAVIAGGLTGRGLGLGNPDFVPLAHSDFIFAAIVEELGAVVGLAALALYAVLLFRLLRTALLLPPGQIFERLLLVGIAVHFFTQVFIMVGGTLNLLPLTGVTLPFLAQGGVAVMINLAEVGIALAVAERL